MARPAKSYEEKVKPYLKDIREWRDQDVSIVQVAKRLNVTQPFLNAKAKEYPELEAALKARPLTEEELKRKEENEAAYRTRYLSSTKSFIRRHATFEEKQDFIALILEKSSEIEQEKIIKQILELRKKE
ncbi:MULTISPECIES: hypothetical protein [Lactococcus]|uniref:Uncharacterized protein n=2 Tax=Lactococcus TaxID=1357 RepID=A0A1I4IT73_9LACT|nr:MULTISPECIES: hypothetical protein [Lactococcus]MDG6156815.1 hypothetical protein [Lactococcus formosensis]MDT2528028.1 hypothetical protein [Lactococcus petauri]MDT2561302.1 hypothetical protein [Lactococcus petauri]MDT2563340.1 hypothetical protein [Lactococcus petauri]MDT2586645.1 hypothetical protein [Lactococcus petauri]